MDRETKSVLAVLDSLRFKYVTQESDNLSGSHASGWLMKTHTEGQLFFCFELCADNLGGRKVQVLVFLLKPASAAGAVWRFCFALFWLTGGEVRV